MNEQRGHCVISLVLVSKVYMKSEVTGKTSVYPGKASGDLLETS